MGHHVPDYAEVFNVRGSSYNEACRRCPQARETERSLLIQRLDIEPGHRICDAPAGGGYLAEGIERLHGNHQEIVCIEPARGFINGIDPRFSRVGSSLTHLALKSNTIDRMGSLAGLHHVNEKRDFVRETYRVLAPGGKIAIADVQDGTAVSSFLNDSVDRLSETGHKGIFFKPGELTFLLQANGFEEVSEEHVRFTWDFPDTKTLVWYCKQLFGLVKGECADVEAELGRFFCIDETDGVAGLPWSLVYSVGTKPL
jgi:SAM-dependent methyltransferase